MVRDEIDRMAKGQDGLDAATDAKGRPTRCEERLWGDHEDFHT
jgi:hypothetical protein